MSFGLALVLAFVFFLAALACVIPAQGVSSSSIDGREKGNVKAARWILLIALLLAIGFCGCSIYFLANFK